MADGSTDGLVTNEALSLFTNISTSAACPQLHRDMQWDQSRAHFHNQTCLNEINIEAFSLTLKNMSSHLTLISYTGIVLRNVRTDYF